MKIHFNEFTMIIVLLNEFFEMSAVSNNFYRFGSKSYNFNLFGHCDHSFWSLNTIDDDGMSWDQHYLNRILCYSHPLWTNSILWQANIMIFRHFLVFRSIFLKLLLSGVPKYYIWLESCVWYLSDGILYMVCCFNK